MRAWYVGYARMVFLYARMVFLYARMVFLYARILFLYARMVFLYARILFLYALRVVWICVHNRFNDVRISDKRSFCRDGARPVSTTNLLNICGIFFIGATEFTKLLQSFQSSHLRVSYKCRAEEAAIALQYCRRH